MPMTRITLREGYGEAQLRQISAILHDALVETFAVPAGDRFQLFEALPAGRRAIDPHYLSGGRSADFILFQIVAGRPRSDKQKQCFYRLLSQRLHDTLAIHPDDVMVVIQYNSASDWSFSGGEMYRPAPQ